MPVLGLSLVLPSAPALSSWDGGHMQIACLAYKDYLCCAPDPETVRMRAFVHAATLGDDIKEKPDDVNDAVSAPTASQNVGHAPPV